MCIIKIKNKQGTRGFIIGAAIIVIMLACCLVLFNIVNSRDFQLSGELVYSIPNNDRIIALTFDDGPTEKTDIILEKLKELDLIVTFFLCGQDIEERPHCARAIVSSGHALGNHSYSHQRMVLKSYDFYRFEIDRTNELINQSGYIQEIFFRPPYGKKLVGLPQYLNSINMVTATWNIEPETYLGFDASPEAIAQYVIDRVESGSIILLHPMYNTNNVLQAMDIFVPELRKQGYSFDTIPAMYGKYLSN